MSVSKINVYLQNENIFFMTVNVQTVKLEAALHNLVTEMDDRLFKAIVQKYRHPEMMRKVTLMLLPEKMIVFRHLQRVSDSLEGVTVLEACQRCRLT